MNDPHEFSEAHQELIRFARKPRLRTDAERVRTTARLAPVVLGLGTSWWWAGKAMAALLIAGTIATVGARIVTEHTRPMVVPARILRVRQVHTERAAAVTLPPAVHTNTDAGVTAVPSIARSSSQGAITSGVSAITASRLAHTVDRRAGVEPMEIRTAMNATANALPTSQETPSPVAPIERMREDQCLSRAQVLLSASPSGALEQVEQCATMFPAGSMEAERELIALEALRREGRTMDLRVRAERFVAANPRSIYMDRVRHMLSVISRDE